MGNDLWFVQKEGMVLGPYTRDQLRVFVERGKVLPSDGVSTHADTGWVTVQELPWLSDATTVWESPSTPPSVSKSPGRAWYVARGDVVVGPLDLDGLRAGLTYGKLKIDDRVCEVGTSEWVLVSEVPELAQLLPPAAPSASTGSIMNAAVGLPPQPMPGAFIGAPSSDASSSAVKDISLQSREAGRRPPPRSLNKLEAACVTILIGCTVLFVVRWRLASHADPSTSFSQVAPQQRVTPALPPATQIIPYLVQGDVMVDEQNILAGVNLMAAQPVAGPERALANCEIRVGLPTNAGTDYVFHIPRLASRLNSPPYFQQACEECRCSARQEFDAETCGCLAERGFLMSDCAAHEPRRVGAGVFTMQCAEGAFSVLIQPRNDRAAAGSLASAGTILGCLPVGSVFPSGEVCRTGAHEANAPTPAQAPPIPVAHAEVIAPETQTADTCNERCGNQLEACTNTCAARQPLAFNACTARCMATLRSCSNRCQ